MKRAIIYGRTSTSKQSSESIETQIAECRKWAEANDCLVVEVYDDSGQSGRSYNVGNRSGFQQIKADAKAGRMDFALIHKIDRFARSVADYFIQERELEQYNVKIIVVGMPYFQNADIVTKSVHIAMAEQFSINLSNEVSTKMRTFAHKAAFLGGKPPYGFKVVGEGKEKKLAIKEEEAIGVRLIYDLYLQGFGYIQISKRIYEQGFSNALGAPFTASHVAKVLGSQKYNGCYVYGARETVNGKERNTRDKSKLIVVPDIYDKIIDDKTFKAVQERLQSNETKPKRRIRYYPFTGLTTCGCCGKAVTGYCTVKKDRGKTYTYYRCTGKKVNGCTLPAINADYLEDFVLSKIKQYIFDEDFTERLIKETEACLSGDVEGFKKAKATLEKELQAVNGQIKEAMRDKYAKKIDEGIYLELVQEFENSKQSLETRLANINQQINVSDNTAEIKAYVENLKNRLEFAEDSVKYAFLKEAVHSIILTPEKAEVFLYMSAPPFRSRLYKTRLSNIVRGVPLFTLDGQAKMYAEQGLNLVSFSTSPIYLFNMQK